MRLLKFAGLLYTGILLVLLLFPPWTDQFSLIRGYDPASSPLGHHWRFRLPYHWGYNQHYCLDASGNDYKCGGDSVWVRNSRAVVDFRMLKYESAVGLILSAFVALFFDLVNRLIAGTKVWRKKLVSRFARSDMRP
jgi:hypothetical protein